MTRAATILATVARTLRRSDTDTHRPELASGWAENFPFYVLIDTGWRVVRASDAHTRRRRVGPVNTVAFGSPDGHTAIFDIDRRGRMSDHATYTLVRPDGDAATFFAYTPGGAAAITVDPDRHIDDLARLPGVRRIR